MPFRRLSQLFRKLNFFPRSSELCVAALQNVLLAVHNIIIVYISIRGEKMNERTRGLPFFPIINNNHNNNNKLDTHTFYRVHDVLSQVVNK